MLRIIEVKALPDGGHRSQGYHGEVMDGYALIPGDMETPNFPYGEVEAELLPFGEQDPETGEVEKVMTVTKWTPGEVPEPVLVEPTPTEKREQAYNTLAVIEWEGELRTVTQAATKWQYYAAEGSAKADELQVLIAAAKETIRAQYPDEEADTE